MFMFSLHLAQGDLLLTFPIVLGAKPTAMRYTSKICDFGLACPLESKLADMTDMDA